MARSCSPASCTRPTSSPTATGSPSAAAAPPAPPDALLRGGRPAAAAPPTRPRDHRAPRPPGPGVAANAQPRAPDGTGDGTAAADRGADEPAAKPVPPVPDTTPPRIIIVSRTI